jgi:hypothetical protein
MVREPPNTLSLKNATSSLLPFKPGARHIQSGEGFVLGYGWRKYTWCPFPMKSLPRLKCSKKGPATPRMQYKIMALNPISSRYHENFMRPCQLRLTEYFRELGYNHPELETELLLIHIGGVWKYFATHQLDVSKEKVLVGLMKRKYAL